MDFAAMKMGFEKWLRQRAFAPNTIDHSLADFSTLLKRVPAPAPLRRTFIRTVRRIAAYGAEAGDQAAAEFAQSIEERLLKERPSRFGGRRYRPRPSKGIDDVSWEKLIAVVRTTPGLAARVLEVMAETGLRVNDAMQIRPHAVRRAFDLGAPLTVIQKGFLQRKIDLRGGEAAWRHLLQEVGNWDYTSDTTLAQLISPRSKHTTHGPSAPYQKVRRTLVAICKTAGIEEKVWTHRFRHTFATRLQDETGDILLVRDTLGHRFVGTTERYAGRTKPEKIAAALQKISVQRRTGQCFGGCGATLDDGDYCFGCKTFIGDCCDRSRGTLQKQEHTPDAHLREPTSEALARVSVKTRKDGA
jgi:integrase